MKKFLLSVVETKEDIKKFHEVAKTIYKGDKNWVCPLFDDIEHTFSPTHNELFVVDGGGEAIRWVLSDQNGKLVGRIAAFYNRKKALAEMQPTGGCGFFECINSFEGATVLFDAARDWLLERGMEAMDGSINFGDRMQWWGVLVDGFTMPLYAMNYNKPYYAALFEAYGFGNYFNQITYLRELKPQIQMPEALYNKAQRLFANPEYSFKTFDKKQTLKMAEDFCSIYNKAWAKFEGVKPLTLNQAQKMILTMKPIIDSDVLYMSYYKDEPIGFFVMIPDINQIIRDFGGKFTFFNKLRFLCRLKCKRINRLAGLIFGVVPEFQSHGVEAAMIRMFEIYTQQKRTVKKVQYRTLEMGWVGDFNPVMMRMCESYVRAVRYKRNITFRYLFDRSKEFTRAPRRRK